MSATWEMARRSAWAHRSGLTGTGLVLALAGLLVAAAGVLAESGIRSGEGQLVALVASFSGTVSVVVVMVVVATVSLALQGRRQELALLRTVGATRSQLRAQVGLEVLLVGIVAAPVGGVLGLLLAGRTTSMLRGADLLGTSDALSIGVLPVLAATALLLPLAWLSARLAVRRTLGATPADAVRDGALESDGIGVVRRVAAVVIAALGLGAAFSPVFVPGTVGSASAATSAFLLVGAAALAGPVLVRWAFDHVSGRRRLRGPAGRLAVANLRGSAQRLAVVVVPLALALTAGTAQTTVDRTVAVAATTQLRDGLDADVVASVDAGLDKGLDAAAASAVADVPGVVGTTVLASAPAEVLTDTDMDGVVDALAWEPTAVRSLAPGPTGLLADPDVTDGSLGDLAAPDTIAVSSDATFETGAGVGDTVRLRWADGTTAESTVVAVYDRGLGFGPYLAGPGTLEAHDGVADTVLVSTAPGASDDVAAGLAALGLDTQTPAAYADSAGSADAAERHLSTVLLALLAFVLLAAANTLVMVTARRRDELRLYARTGATRAQLVRMAVVEAGLTGALAWAVGTVAVLPAVLGVGFGMLGPAVPPVDLAAYAGLSLVVLALPLLTVVPTVARQVRRPVA
jgi:putative ABC transport system permease protein